MKTVDEIMEYIAEQIEITENELLDDKEPSYARGYECGSLVTLKNIKEFIKGELDE